jgi:hypothetical protein
LNYLLFWAFPHGVWVHAPQCGDQIKKGQSFCFSHSFYAKGFKDVRDIQNWMKSSSKKE